MTKMSVGLIGLGAFLLPGLCLSQSPEKPGLSLPECYALALKRSEAIAIRQDRIEEVRGERAKTISTFLPKGSFVLTEFRQDSQLGAVGGSGVGGTFNLRSRPERRWTLKQPLFQGFREFAALSAAGALEAQRCLEVARAKDALYLDVAQAFYGILEPRAELGIFESIRGLTKERIAELEERVRLGRSRASEVASANARLKTVEAEMEQARRQESIWWNALKFLTGEDLAVPIVDLESEKVSLGPLAEALKRSMDRSDIRAIQEAVRVARNNMVVARADLFPSVSFTGNYYSKRVGFQEATDWDAQLVFDVPLFEIVKVSGALREAKAQLRQAQQELSRLLRLAQSEIQTAHERLELSLAEVQAYVQAEAAAEENYRIQTEEYRMNLVNNLDVLNALEELQAVRRSHLKSRFQAKQDAALLRVALGKVH